MKPEQVKNRIDRILVLKEWLDNRVSEVFTDYCNTFGIHRAYGVEAWSTGWNDLRIVQDITCRGCYDTQTHDLPVEYLYLERPERLELMQTHKAAKDAVKEQQKRRDKEAELARAIATVQRLSQEVS